MIAWLNDHPSALVVLTMLSFWGLMAAIYGIDRLRQKRRQP